MPTAPPLRVADVFRAYGTDYLQTHRVPAYQQKAVRHIRQCRTPALGGHVWQCASCGHRAVLYNSCRDRHCPTCQGAAREKWLNQRMRELLPVPYFHVVFTLPHALNPLIRYNRKPLIDLFFKEVNATLQEFARDPQWRLEGQLGFIAVLHTWNQQLREHNHLHLAIPGGVWRASAKPSGEDGRKNAGRWVPAKRNWLFRAESLAARFRTRYLRALERKLAKGQLVLPPDGSDWASVRDRLARTDWIVYVKKPFAGPRQVLEYLGRYTHKVAISDYRILAIENGQVAFRYRDRGDGDVEKSKTLPAADFITRFLLHILPRGMQKIRFCGWMGRNVRRANLRAIRQSIGVPPPDREAPVPPTAPTCPCCGQPALLRILGQEQPRAPPESA
jgi:hypothetical protein